VLSTSATASPALLQLVWCIVTYNIHAMGSGMDNMLCVGLYATLHDTVQYNKLNIIHYNFSYKPTV